METVNEVIVGKPPPPSPLTGCYLLILLGEPYYKQHKDVILHRLSKGLLSWNVNDCLVDLENELDILTQQVLEGEETKYGERLIQFASESLVTEILIHPSVSTLLQCIRNLLSSFTRHRHIIHSGYTYAGNGSWILQDGTFSYNDFSELFQEIEVQRVIRAYENCISMDIHCENEGEWTRLPKEHFAKSVKLRLNPNDILTAGSPSIISFVDYISTFLVPAELDKILENSDLVGNIRFSRPTLYVFPGGQGDAALFGINGFNMLLDGGFSRRACFWDFVRHLDRLDAVMFTRLNNSNVSGVSSLLQRKEGDALYPQIGHFFCNIPERKCIPSPDGDKDKDPLLIDLFEEGHKIVSNLRHINLNPQTCYRDSEPQNLYHKVGHGTLDMYIISPSKDSKEVKEFLQKWNNNDQKLFSSRKSPREFLIPLQNAVSICALFIWQPANPNDTITRILFPGSAPQEKLFEGLEKLKQIESLKYPSCSAKNLSSHFPVKTKQKDIFNKMSYDKQIRSVDEKENSMITTENQSGKITLKNKTLNGIHQTQIISQESLTENERVLTKQQEGKGPEMSETKEKPKVRTRAEARLSKTHTEEPKKRQERKGFHSYQKKSEEGYDDAKNKIISKASPAKASAKSAKDANNRKMVETRLKSNSKKVPSSTYMSKERKPETKPNARRPTELKEPGSPVKKINGVSHLRRTKLEKEGTDSSTVSTPSIDQVNIPKLSQDEMQQLDHDLAELKEEQEVVKEIEAVLMKFDKKETDTKEDESYNVREIQGDAVRVIEYKEDESTSKSEAKHLEEETEAQKLKKDSEESEKNNKVMTKDILDSATEETSLDRDGKKQYEADIEHASGDEVHMVMPVKKSTDAFKRCIERDGDDDIKETVDSQRDEKVSGTAESGATTTAPTLPEDEKIVLNEKRDDGDNHGREIQTKEETKEFDSEANKAYSKPYDTVPKLSNTVGITLDRQAHVRDIVKTPDEVAELPVHEEVDIVPYQEFESKEKDDDKRKQSSIHTIKMEVADGTDPKIDQSIQQRTEEEFNRNTLNDNTTENILVDEADRECELPINKQQKGTFKHDKSSSPKLNEEQEVDGVKISDSVQVTGQEVEDNKAPVLREDMIISVMFAEGASKNEVDMTHSGKKQSPLQTSQTELSSDIAVLGKTFEELKDSGLCSKTTELSEKTIDHAINHDRTLEEKVEDSRDSDRIKPEEQSEQNIFHKESIHNDKAGTFDRDIEEATIDPKDEKHEAVVKDQLDYELLDLEKRESADESKLNAYPIVELTTVKGMSTATCSIETYDTENIVPRTETDRLVEDVSEDEQTKIKSEEVRTEQKSLDKDVDNKGVSQKKEEWKEHGETTISTVDMTFQIEEMTKCSEIEKESTTTSPTTEELEQRCLIEKANLGRKSPKEREEDVAKIVASVAEVLKSDAPLEELEGKLLFSVTPLSSHITELRESHITTDESESDTLGHHHITETKLEEAPEDMKQTLYYFLEKERDLDHLISVEKLEFPDDRNKSLASEPTGVSEKDLEDSIVHRMVVTASSEDGGEETEICSTESVLPPRSLDNSRRSSSDHKLSEKDYARDRGTGTEESDSNICKEDISSKLEISSEVKSPHGELDIDAEVIEAATSETEPENDETLIITKPGTTSPKTEEQISHEIILVKDKIVSTTDRAHKDEDLGIIEEYDDTNKNEHACSTADYKSIDEDRLKEDTSGERKLHDDAVSKQFSVTETIAEKYEEADRKAERDLIMNDKDILDAREKTEIKTSKEQETDAPNLFVGHEDRERKDTNTFKTEIEKDQQRDAAISQTLKKDAEKETFPKNVLEGAAYILQSEVGINNEIRTDENKDNQSEQKIVTSDLTDSRNRMENDEKKTKGSNGIDKNIQLKDDIVQSGEFHEKHEKDADIDVADTEDTKDIVFTAVIDDRIESVSREIKKGIISEETEDMTVKQTISDVRNITDIMIVDKVDDMGSLMKADIISGALEKNKKDIDSTAFFSGILREEETDSKCSESGVKDGSDQSTETCDTEFTNQQVNISTEIQRGEKGSESEKTSDILHKQSNIAADHHSKDAKDVIKEEFPDSESIEEPSNIHAKFDSKFQFEKSPDIVQETSESKTRIESYKEPISETEIPQIEEGVGLTESEIISSAGNKNNLEKVNSSLKHSSEDITEKSEKSDKLISKYDNKSIYYAYEKSTETTSTQNSSTDDTEHSIHIPSYTTEGDEANKMTDKDADADSCSKFDEVGKLGNIREPTSKQNCIITKEISENSDNVKKRETSLGMENTTKTTEETYELGNAMHNYFGAGRDETEGRDHDHDTKLNGEKLKEICGNVNKAIPINDQIIHSGDAETKYTSEVVLKSDSPIDERTEKDIKLELNSETSEKVDEDLITGAKFTETDSDRERVPTKSIPSKDILKNSFSEVKHDDADENDIKVSYTYSSGTEEDEQATTEIISSCAGIQEEKDINDSTPNIGVGYSDVISEASERDKSKTDVKKERDSIEQAESDYDDNATSQYGSTDFSSEKFNEETSETMKDNQSGRKHSLELVMDSEQVNTGGSKNQRTESKVWSAEVIVISDSKELEAIVTFGTLTKSPISSQNVIKDVNCAKEKPIDSDTLKERAKEEKELSLKDSTEITSATKSDNLRCKNADDVNLGSKHVLTSLTHSKDTSKDELDATSESADTEAGSVELLPSREKPVDIESDVSQSEQEISSKVNEKYASEAEKIAQQEHTNLDDSSMPESDIKNKKEDTHELVSDGKMKEQIELKIDHDLSKVKDMETLGNDAIQLPPAVSSKNIEYEINRKVFDSNKQTVENGLADINHGSNKSQTTTKTMKEIEVDDKVKYVPETKDLSKAEYYTSQSDDSRKHSTTSDDSHIQIQIIGSGKGTSLMEDACTVAEEKKLEEKFSSNASDNAESKVSINFPDQLSEATLSGFVSNGATSAETSTEEETVLTVSSSSNVRNVCGVFLRGEIENILQGNTNEYGQRTELSISNQITESNVKQLPTTSSCTNADITQSNISSAIATDDCRTGTADRSTLLSDDVSRLPKSTEVDKTLRGDEDSMSESLKLTIQHTESLPKCKINEEEYGLKKLECDDDSDKAKVIEGKELSKQIKGFTSSETPQNKKLEVQDENTLESEKESQKCLKPDSKDGGSHTLASQTQASKSENQSYGKPLKLPSPVVDGKNNAKKERKALNISAKNKINEARKRAESPKQANQKTYPVYVDLTYVPHHGNSFYTNLDFFKRIRARYYVFSGIEPSKELYDALLEAKQTWEDKDLEVTIIPTYDTDILGYWVAENEELLTKYKIDLSPSANRCTINLQDHETSCSAYRLEF